MRIIGLTGGIGSGKSTVARMLNELGCPVVDADQLAREVVRPGEPAYAELVAAFGPQILVAGSESESSSKSGREIDRKRLGAIAFADPEARRRLNAITHPRIAARSQARLAELAAKGYAVAVYEAALLVENGIHHALDGLIVVSVDEATQRRRVAERDGLGPAEVEARLAAQAPLADKLAAATFVVDNSGDLARTRAEVARIWTELSQGASP